MWTIVSTLIPARLEIIGLHQRPVMRNPEDPKHSASIVRLMSRREWINGDYFDIAILIWWSELPMRLGLREATHFSVQRSNFTPVTSSTPVRHHRLIWKAVFFRKRASSDTRFSSAGFGK
jgi:hypothetical protein